MSITRGRRLEARRAEHAVPIAPARTEPVARGRRVPRVWAEALVRADAAVKDAERRAADLIRQAQAQAAEIRLRAEEEARADAAASLAAKLIALSEHEARLTERQLDRIVEIAKLLAERLLGRALELDAELVVDLARQLLREARGARHIVIGAHPEDVPLLSHSLRALGLDPALAKVEADPQRVRGNLRLVTEIGILDGNLSPQLERLALRLRESLIEVADVP
jgi:flagellar biosynthesis/type III secretory pathway protein FliH